ncbi:hypothetical protein [Pseudoalteromonas sp. GB56]
MENLNGMTVNERLFALKKLNAFDEAIKAKNTELSIQILEATGLSHLAAVETVAMIFKNPSNYGY